ncbi:unnamed protein product, partial [Mesorhabditis spiculigera]
MFSTRLFASAALVAVLFVCQCKGVPVAKPEDGALITVGAETTALIPTSSNSTELLLPPVLLRMRLLWMRRMRMLRMRRRTQEALAPEPPYRPHEPDRGHHQEESSPIEATEQLKSQTTNPIIAKLAAFSPAHLLTNLHDQFKQAVRQLVL